VAREVTQGEDRSLLRWQATESAVQLVSIRHGQALVRGGRQIHRDDAEMGAQALRSIFGSGPGRRQQSARYAWPGSYARRATATAIAQARIGRDHAQLMPSGASLRGLPSVPRISGT
jgi:hypothetical protein